MFLYLPLSKNVFQIPQLTMEIYQTLSQLLPLLYKPIPNAVWTKSLVCFFSSFFFLVGGLHMTLNYWKWTYKTLSKSIRTSTPQGCYVVLPEQPFPLCVSYAFVCSVAHFILATNSFISTAAWSQLFCTLVTHVSCHGSGWSMLLAQLNRDSQGMTEFHDADGQPVTLCLTEAVTVAGELN